MELMRMQPGHPVLACKADVGHRTGSTQGGGKETMFHAPNRESTGHFMSSLLYLSGKINGFATYKYQPDGVAETSTVLVWEGAHNKR